MKAPDTELQAKMNKLGVYIQPKEHYSVIAGNAGKFLVLTAEIGYPLGVDLDTPDFNIETVNRREVKTTFSNFKITDRDEQKVLSFTIMQRIPDAIDLPRPPTGMLATTFIDLGWYAGNEAVDPAMVPAVGTKPHADAVFTDLGWYLPSRFVDTLIDAVGKVSSVFLDGAGEEAILYGYGYIKDGEHQNA